MVVLRKLREEEREDYRILYSVGNVAANLSRIRGVLRKDRGLSDRWAFRREDNWHITIEFFVRR